MAENIFFILSDGEQRGPYTLGQIRSMWHAGSVTADQLYWTEGNSEWKPLLSIVSIIERPPAQLPKEELRPPMPEVQSQARQIPELQAQKKTPIPRSQFQEKPKKPVSNTILADVSIGVATVVTCLALNPNTEKHGGFFFLVLALAYVHFLPSVIAGKRFHKNATAVWLVNLLLGWTLIGWVAALVWAVLRDQGGDKQTIQDYEEREKAYVAYRAEREASGAINWARLVLWSIPALLAIITLIGIWWALSNR